MKTSSSLRALVLALVLLAGVIILVVVRALGSYGGQEQPQPACLQIDTRSMTSAQLSTFLNIPLVMLSDLPENVSATPEVLLDVEYPIESPVCGLKIIYTNLDTGISYVDIELLMVDESRGIIDEPDEPTTWSWSCLEFEFRYEVEPARNQMRSICSNTLEVNEGHLYVRVSSQGSVEETRRIAELVVISE